MSDCVSLLTTIIHEASVVSDLIKNPLSGIAAACVQAAETEHAARIQAEAALQAGNKSLLAGFMAGTAALIAARVAYRAARLQANILTDQYDARTTAYKHQFAYLIEASYEELKKHSSLFQNSAIVEMTFKTGLGLDLVATNEFLSEITPANYERMSLLGQAFQPTIFSLYLPLRALYRQAENFSELLKNEKERKEILDYDWFPEVRDKFVREFVEISPKFLLFRDEFRASISQ